MRQIVWCDEILTFVIIQESLKLKPCCLLGPHGLHCHPLGAHERERWPEEEVRSRPQTRGPLTLPRHSLCRPHQNGFCLWRHIRCSKVQSITLKQSLYQSNSFNNINNYESLLISIAKLFFHWKSNLLTVGHIRICSSVAIGSIMGHLHPPSPSFQAKDRNEFYNFICKSLILRFFRRNCEFAPPRQISGNATTKISMRNVVLWFYSKHSRLNFLLDSIIHCMILHLNTVLDLILICFVSLNY